MGIIIRQSVKSSIVNFFGVGIAAFSALFIYPKYEEIYGFGQFLIGTATLCYPIASIGLVSALLKFFPKFKSDDNTNRGFLSLVFLTYVVLFTLFACLSLLFKDFIVDWFQRIGLDKQGILGDNFIVILVLAALVILTALLMNYAASYKRIVVPQIINQLGLKVFMPIAILTYALYEWTEMQFATALLIFYGCMCIALIIYLNYLGVFKLSKPDWKFLDRDLKKEILSYKFFSSYNHLGSILSYNIDRVMIPMILTTATVSGYANNGIYAIMLFMSNVIEIPSRSVKAIAAPIISASWESKDMAQIKNIYQKSSLNLVIPGAAILMFIWFSFDAIAQISTDPSKILAGKYVFLFLGCGKLLDMITSVNDHIIIYSPKYKYNLIFIFILAIVNIYLNIVLIKEYGIVGAAVASAIAYTLYNSIKMIFIYWNYKMQPFTKEVFAVLIIAGLVAVGLYFIPSFDFYFMNIILNALIIGTIFFPIIYFLNLSPDFNKLCNLALQKIRALV